MIKALQHSLRMLLFISILSFVSHGQAVAVKKSTPPTKGLMTRAYLLASRGQVKKTLDELAYLQKLERKRKRKDLMDDIDLLRARVLFNAKKYSRALESYNKIDKNSDFWLDAVVERAWVKVYLGMKNEAIADSHTLMSPLFKNDVGPEAFYLSAYVSHQICDFSRVFKIIQDFKSISAEKIVKLESNSSSSKKSRYLLKHYSDVIKKLGLIEADSIQRIYLDQSLSGERFQAGRAHKPGKYDLIFPYEENDVWIDEIDQIKVDAKNCPQLLKKVAAK